MPNLQARANRFLTTLAVPWEGKSSLSKVGWRLSSEDPAETGIGVGAGNAATRLVYCAWFSPSYRAGLELVSLLAHHSTELVGGGGN